MIKINLSKWIALTFISSFFIINYSFSQNNEDQCKVLLQEISETYIGDSKDGFAHGKGVAKGIDLYKGRFKNGLPHGTGKYIWEDGSYYEGNWRNGKKSGKGFLYTALTKEELKGIWKDDEFFKEIVDPPYEVILKSGVTGINFYEYDATPYRIEVVFQKDGSQSSTVAELTLSSTSGQSKISNSFSGFENVLFPFEGYLEFVSPSRMGTVMLRYQVKFKIIKESSWRI
ncbi:MAG: hypothetical protein KAQ75_07415, partial [Bacteroidales bacterium]|nr:hypothetical protein [Bacteroidales bacterium]